MTSNFHKKAGSMGFPIRRNRVFIIDVCVFPISIWLAYFVRLGGDPAYYEQIELLVILVFVAVPMKVLILYLAGIYRIYWRYLDADTIRKLLISSFLGWMLFILALACFQILGLFNFSIMIPRSVLFLDLLLSFPLLLIGHKAVYLRASLYIFARLTNRWSGPGMLAG